MSKKKNNIFYKLGRAVAKARISYREGLYSLHLKQRYLHDVTYEKGGWYKSWTDKKYSNAVHKAVLVSFIFSFAFFSVIQSIFPFFNLGRPTEVLAGTTQKVWDTLADFTNNDGITENVTSENVDLNNGNPRLSTTPGESTQNNTAQFDTHTKSNTSVGTDTIYLLKPIGATCSLASECATGACNGTCFNPWIAGRAGTALAGKYIYYQNLSSDYVWKTSQSSCISPQCTTGLDSNYPSNYSLVSSNTVDFSLYTARNACKNIGGRLPYMHELLEIYAGRATYGNNFGLSRYWSGTESSSTYAYSVYFDGGLLRSNPKDGTNTIRCVK
ncbi:MAG: hypothetical protein PHW75_02600 [Patescibacteria group bacterium]|nr:hypothetical protein [Patescibacteria group bacterium]